MNPRKNRRYLENRERGKLFINLLEDEIAPSGTAGGLTMTIRQIRNDIEIIKKTIKPDHDIVHVAIYRGELGSLEAGIRQGSIVAIDGKDVSHLDPDDTQAMLSSAKTLILIPDNGRDPGIWM